MIVEGKRNAEWFLGKRLTDPKYKGMKYFALSETGERLFGGYKTKKEAKKRLGQVEMFKRMKNPGVLPVPKVSKNPRKKLYIQPNQASMKAAERGLKAREMAPKSKKGGLDAMQAKEEGVGSGVLRARDIVAGKRVNAYQVKAFFDRHRGNYLAAKDKGLKPQESRAIQAWLLWGGDPLYKQAKAAVKKDRKKNPARRVLNPKPFWDKQHDWDQVLINRDGRRRTRKQILNYYLKNQKKIWPYLKGQTVLVIFGRGRNDFVLRRKGPDGKHIKLTKLEGIDDPNSFEYWIYRRAIEFHPVLTGKTTDLIWIDVDPYKKARGKSMAKMQRQIRRSIPLMKRLLKDEFGVTKTKIWRSGKSDGGWHIEGVLPRKMNINKMRVKLRKALDDYFADDPAFTTTIARPGQIRLDTTLTKTMGSLRAPYSYTVDGHQKLQVQVPGIAKPIKKKRKAKRNPPMTASEYEQLKVEVERGRGRLHQELEHDPFGVGGTRLVYKVEIPGREPFVFKADAGDGDVSQTKMEIDCLYDLQSPLAPQVFDHDDKGFRWLEMEVLDQMEPDAESRSRFKWVTGVKWDDFEFAFEDLRGDVSPAIREDLYERLGKSEKSKRFLDDVLAIIEHCAIEPYEMSVIENWGTTPDGRSIKLLDLGG